MATSEILLVKPVENLGNEGDSVKVKAGYARNYLLPRKLAVPMTQANRRQMEVLKARSEARLRNEREVAEHLQARLESLRIALAVRTGPGGKVFGSVTAANLQERLKEEGVELDRKQIHLYSPVKSLGKHETRIRLHPEIAVDFVFEVVSENPIEESEDPSSEG